MPNCSVRVGVATATVVALTALTPVSAEAEQRASERYVSMGDSYVAGALTGAPTDAPFSCFQTDGNYPHLVAPALAVDEHVDVSCSSAKTDDVFTPQKLDDGFSTAPPQLDAVNEDTAVVSLGFGGNDIGIREALEHCFSPVPSGSPCRDHFVTAGQDELARRIAETGPKIDRVIDAIRSRAPRAEVFVVGYPSIFDDTGKGCWPVVPLTAPDTVYLRDTIKRLNTMLASQARANGAAYVDTYTPGIGRDMCQLPGARWIEGLVPTEPASPLHPNARGERGMADALLAVMIRRGLSG